MGIEIERKFLVKNFDYRKTDEVHLLKQGYILNSIEKKVVRVRITDEQGFITIKGKTESCSRLEYEYEIPLKDAEELLIKLCEVHVIEKRRYIINHCGFVWEVDEFLGDNNGLIVAEIELENEDAEFPLPEWVGEEVSYDHRYLNSHLAKKPFSKW